jgi:hypothetical protein
MADEFLTKEEADKLYLSQEGGALRGMLGLPITMPTNPYHAAHRAAVEELMREWAKSFVQRPGDEMTGFLALHANPTQDLHAATKAYVDAHVRRRRWSGEEDLLL